MHNAAPQTFPPAGVIPLTAFQDMSGLEVLLALMAGEVPPPPISEVFSFYPVTVEKGLTVFECRPERRLYNPYGTVHGGFAATLLDTAMTCAVQTVTEAGEFPTTVEIKISYTRPITERTGLVRAEGRLLHRGRQIATAEGRLVDAEGRLLAHGTTTCQILPVPARPDNGSVRP